MRTVEHTIVTKTEVRSFVISNCRFLTASLGYHLPNDQVENERLGMLLLLCSSMLLTD